MYNNLTDPLEISGKLMDAYVGIWVTAWFWPYFIMGNVDSWQKLGITMNGARPLCITQPYQNQNSKLR
jgi:hypothetical protein